MKICLAKSKRHKIKREIDRLIKEKGFERIIAMPVAINARKIIGLKRNRIISGIAIFFGNKRRLFKRSFRHLTHNPINWLARRTFILNFSIKLDGKLV